MRRMVIVSAFLLGTGFGCGGSDEQAQDPSLVNGQYGQGQYGQQQPGQYAPGTYPTATAPTATAPATGTAPAGGMATPIAPAAAAAATPVLQAMAASEVRGMSPEGGAFAGQFQQGQILEQTFNIQPGKCYSVIGVGVGITELDIQISTVPPAPMIPPMTLAQDSTTGPNATVGGGGNCFKNPLPIGGPAKVVMKATAGSGIAVAQIFVK